MPGLRVEFRRLQFLFGITLTIKTLRDFDFVTRHTKEDPLLQRALRKIEDVAPYGAGK